MITPSDMKKYWKPGCTCFICSQVIYEEDNLSCDMVLTKRSKAKLPIIFHSKCYEKEVMYK